MFEQFFSFLSGFWHELIPIAVVQPWEMGIRLRFCKKQAVLQPGWHYKIPYVDECMIHGVAMTAVQLTPQTVTTSDGKEIVIEAVVRYEIDDIETMMLRVMNAMDGVKDLSEGAIARIVGSKTREECKNTAQLQHDCSIAARKEVKKWGVALDQIIFTTFASCRSLRLINGQHHGF